MASKRHLRRRACERKVRHATKDEAKTALRQAIRRWGHTGKFTYYPCPHCGGYHVGHAKKPRVRNR